MTRPTYAASVIFFFAFATALSASAADRSALLDPRAKADPKNADAYFAVLADDQDGYYAAMKIADLGPGEVPRVVEALSSADPIVRKWAARTLTDMGAEKAAAARGPLVRALAREGDEAAQFNLVQAVGVLRPGPKDAVPELVKLLDRPSVDLRRLAAEAIGDLGPGAAAAKPDLIRSIEATSENWFQTTAMRALRQIGMNAEDAKALARANVPDDSDGAREIFRELVKAHPDVAIGFVQRHPKLLASMPDDDLALIDLFARNDAPSAGLRTALGKRKDLPRFILVDYAKGERVGHVMTMPRHPNPRDCFPQRPAVVRVEPGRAVLDRVVADPRYRLWDAEGLVVLIIGEKYGFADAATGRIVIEPRFDHAANFSGGLATVVVGGGKYGYADKSGRLAVPPQFEWGYAFSGGLAAVEQGRKFGLIDTRGRWVKAPVYERIDPWGDGWRAWTFDGMEGTLDNKGEIVGPEKSLR